MADTAQAPPLTGLPATIRLQADPVDWPKIPKPVKQKLRRLRRARDDAWLVWRAVADERQEAWEARRVAEARLKLLKGEAPDAAWYYVAHNSHFQRLEDDHPEVVAQRDALEEANANIERLDSAIDARLHQFEQFNRLLESVEGYLAHALSGVGDAIKLYKGQAPSLRKGEAVVDAVERCRRRLRELDADRHRIASAPWHSSDAKRRARAEIDALAERGQPNVLPLIESCDESIYWAERLLHRHGHRGPND